MFAEIPEIADSQVLVFRRFYCSSHSKHANNGFCLADYLNHHERSPCIFHEIMLAFNYAALLFIVKKILNDPNARISSAIFAEQIQQRRPKGCHEVSVLSWFFGNYFKNYIPLVCPHAWRQKFRFGHKQIP